MPEDSTQNIVLFDFTPKDLKELTRLSREYFTELFAYDETLLFAEDWDRGYRNLMGIGIDSERFQIRGARLDKKVVGFVMFGYRIESLWQVSNRGYLSNIYVIPSHRGRGIGRMLVRDAIERMRAAGSLVIELEVYATNEAAKSFWDHFGFRTFKHRLRIIP